jgi:hypothetical protein
MLDLKLVGRVAQLVEQRPFKAWVAGSIPAALTIYKSAPTSPLREGLLFFVLILQCAMAGFWRALTPVPTPGNVIIRDDRNPLQRIAL